MTLFILSVVVVLVVSALCSLTEAALYSVRMPYVRQLLESGSAAGRVLARFKENMESPITAILIINTTANTAGAAVAGAQAENLFGDYRLLGVSAVAVFSGLFTLGVLFFSEILPKVAGVTYGRTVSRFVSLPLEAVIWAIYPLVWLSRKAARVVRETGPRRIAPEEEVHQIAALSAEEGSILPLEAALVQNVLRLNEVQARDIMTPRTVVYKLEATRTVLEVAEEAGRVPHTRIPIYHPDDPENWIGMVFKGDVLACLARDEFDVTLESLRKPLRFVPEVVPGHKLLSEFIRRRVHILGVIDEYGGMLGVVTLEDVMESLIGEEIVDETDLVVDLQQVARRRAVQRLGDAASGAGSRDPGGKEPPGGG